MLEKLFLSYIQIMLKEVEVSTACKNEDAIKFYEKIGFNDKHLLLGMELNK